jgi:PAB-dependent poly(A)-specific ribonuclease subunit 3
MDPAWSETGDRYLLKLFRDYVFHQVSADGRPWVDLSHVVYCLNRLDAGALEKVLNCHLFLLTHVNNKM